MAKFFFDKDADQQVLSGLAIGVIGYGNQGRAQALNLRDSGLSVSVGTRKASPSRHKAEEDGFAARSIEEVSASCKVLAVMLPDEVVPAVYKQLIKPCIAAPVSFVFAHGFAVYHKTVSLPDDADVILVAPTGPGRHLRSLYVQGGGLPALLAVEQDAGGLAWQRCLAYARAIGCLRAGGIETTFAEETVIDLYCEQSVLCGGLPELIKASFETLVERGYQSELAYISCLKEVKLIADLLFEKGLDGMREAISNTAKFGSAIAGRQVINNAARFKLEKLLRNIESGAFGKMFMEDSGAGSPVINDLLAGEKHSPLARTGKMLQETLDF